MTRAEMLADLEKNGGGVVAIAKCIAVSGNGPGGRALTEAEFTKMVHNHAQRDRRTGESPDQAFARCFSADTDEGVTLRKAHAIVKSGLGFPRLASLTPIVAGGEGAFNVNNDDRAKDLDEAVRAEMQTAPWLTVEAATARVEAARRAAQAIADGRGVRT